MNKIHEVLLEYFHDSDHSLISSCVSKPSVNANAASNVVITCNPNPHVTPLTESTTSVLVFFCWL